MGLKASSRQAVSIPPFSVFESRARDRKGQAFLDDAMRKPASAKSLRALADDRVLSRMAQGIFSAGFVWKIVENKWPSFEEAFDRFDVGKAASLDELDLDELATDTRVIRNRPKLAAVRDNARYIQEVAGEHGSFGAYLAAWPVDNVVGLLAELATRGSRLGGFTGPMFLRHVGYDTFMPTGDVVKALARAGIIDKNLTSKRSLQTAQLAFNQWRAETGRPLTQLSQLLAFSVD